MWDQIIEFGLEIFTQNKKLRQILFLMFRQENRGDEKAN